MSDSQQSGGTELKQEVFTVRAGVDDCVKVGTAGAGATPEPRLGGYGDATLKFTGGLRVGETVTVLVRGHESFEVEAFAEDNGAGRVYIGSDVAPVDVQVDDVEGWFYVYADEVELSFTQEVDA